MTKWHSYAEHFAIICSILSTASSRLVDESILCLAAFNLFLILSLPSMILYMFCPGIVFRLWDSFWNKLDKKAPIGSANNFKVISDYLKAAYHEANHSGNLSYVETDLGIEVNSKKIIQNFVRKYPPTKFSPESLTGDSSIRFVLLSKIFNAFTVTEKRQISGRLRVSDGFYKGYEIFSPYIPSSTPAKYSIIERSSRILKNLSYSEYYWPKQSKQHIDETTAHLTKVGHYCALPLGMSRQVKTVVIENICRTIVNLTSNPYRNGRIKTGVRIDKQLWLTMENSKEKQFRALVRARTEPQPEVLRMLVVWAKIAITIISIVLIYFGIRIVIDRWQSAVGSESKIWILIGVFSFIVILLCLVVVVYLLFSTQSNYQARQFNRKSLLIHLLSDICQTILVSLLPFSILSTLFFE